VTEQSIDELAGIIRQGLAEDERIAREACGSTVVGEPGNWRQASGGDEWQVEQVDDFIMLLVALRPGLKRSPETRAYWGQVAAWQDDGDGIRGPLEEFTHAARHDPRRVLADVAAKRALLDEALAWEHYEVDDPWYSCSAAPNAPAEHRDHGCTCGRDARVRAVLHHLATSYQEADRG
jgi:hypothetical protein